MIIRGGENIAPAALEAALESSSFGSLGIQIVGSPDETAGEIIVAVTTTTVTPGQAMGIREILARKMGTMCAPDDVISLQQLGTPDFPRTAVGKVQKNKLADLVRNYRLQKQTSSVFAPAHAGTETLDKLKRVWSQTLGLPDETEFTVDTRVANLADSILLMRFRDGILKAFGRDVTLADLAKANTIGEQAALLDRTRPDSNGLKKRTSPPEIGDMVHLIENQEGLQATIEVVEAAIGKYDLTWTDVRAVMPAYDMNRASLLRGSMNLLNLKVSVLTKAGNIQELRLALEKVLVNNPMLASFAVFDGDKLGPGMVLHVVVEHSQRLLDQTICDGGSVQDVADLKEFAAQQRFPEVRDATLPGPLVKATMFRVREVGKLGLVLNGAYSLPDYPCRMPTSNTNPGSNSEPFRMRRHIRTANLRRPRSSPVRAGTAAAHRL
jgi:aryl carrier-like protein